MAMWMKIKNELIKIPFICKLGIWRRKVMGRECVLPEFDWDYIKERYISCKKDLNDDNVYFVIYSNQPQGGLFVYLIDILSQMAYAIEQGYIPVVDMLNFPTNLRNKDQGTVNAWELYFKQPGGACVEDIYGKKNVIFHGSEEERVLCIGDIKSSDVCEKYEVVIDDDRPFQEWYENEVLMYRFKTFWKTYIHYSEEAEKYMDKWYERLFRKGKKVLGVLCRGTDYLSLHPKGHHVQPEVDIVLSKIEEVMKDYACDYVFCATEDAVIYDRLQKKLGEKLVGLDVKRVKYKEGYLLNDLYIKQGMDLYKRQLDYLTEMELLSRCDCLIAGKTTGSRFLPVMKAGEYEYLFYWELGRY